MEEYSFSARNVLAISTRIREFSVCAAAINQLPLWVNGLPPLRKVLSVLLWLVKWYAQRIASDCLTAAFLCLRNRDNPLPVKLLPDAVQPNRG